MMDFIEKLRKKPKRVKKIILYTTSFAFLAIIILFWISTLPYRFTSQGDREKNNSLQEKFRPLSILKENASRAYSEVSKGLSTVSEDIKAGLEEKALGDEESEQNNQ